MEAREISSVGLFRLFQPRFREVAIVPLGFPIHGTDSTNFYFRPEKISGCSWINDSCLDIKKCDLRFASVYHSACGHSPTMQLLYSCWAAIMAGAFAGRKFYADPKPDVDPFSRHNLSIIFSHSGDPIEGLRFTTDLTARSWRYFIPEGTPEHEAIKAALAYEHVQQQELEKVQAPQPAFTPEIAYARLGEALAVVQL